MSSWRASVTTVRFSFLSSQLEILIAPVLIVIMKAKYYNLASVYTVARRKYAIHAEQDGRKDDDGPAED